jgi:cytochrome b subunit of formate dehydrogenase
MANLERRPSRRELEKRAYNLGVGVAATAVATVVTFVLALVTGLSFGWPALLGLLTFALGYGFKRTVTRR